LSFDQQGKDLNLTWNRSDAALQPLLVNVVAKRTARDATTNASLLVSFPRCCLGRLQTLYGPAFRDDLLISLLKADPEIGVAFDLPWPWGGERFELADIRPLNYIIGPLGSGKTRLAKRVAASLPDAAFVGLDRPADGGVWRLARALMPIQP
jgi:hypothetical protein